jgi:hypothetical protein
MAATDTAKQGSAAVKAVETPEAKGSAAVDKTVATTKTPETKTPDTTKTETHDATKTPDKSKDTSHVTKAPDTTKKTETTHDATKTPDTTKTADTGPVDATKGYLQVFSKPPAKILVDGVDTGMKTPISGHALALTPGKHKITFVIGDDRFTYPQVIKAGSTDTMSKDLQ